MIIKTVSFNRKMELVAILESRIAEVIAVSGQVERVELYENGNNIIAALTIGEAPSSGQVVRCMGPEELRAVVDNLNEFAEAKEATADLIGLVALTGSSRFVGTIICRPKAERVESGEPQQGQDEKPDAGPKRGGQRRAVAADRKPDGERAG